MSEGTIEASQALSWAITIIYGMTPLIVPAMLA